MIPFEDFQKVDIRVGKILEAREFPEARKPAYQLKIDFGKDIGVKQSSAQITELYSTDQLPGKNILAVVNFPPRQIGPFRSEVLVLGVYVGDGEVALLESDSKVGPGSIVS